MRLRRGPPEQEKTSDPLFESKDRVEIVQEAMRKTFNDADFHREYRKVVGEDADPLTPEELTKAIRDAPRDPELIEMFKTLSGPAPLPAR